MANRIVKNWRTTIAGVLGGTLMILGVFWPEKLDPGTQQVLNAAVGEILTGVGALVSVISNMIADDPKKIIT